VGGDLVIVLGVPTLTRYDLLDRLFESAEGGALKPDRYLVVDNGGEFTPTPSVLRALARGARVSVLAAGENLGVAASWNAILREAGGPVVISNDDVTLGPETIARLCGADGVGRHAFVIAEGPPHANGWCLFAQTPDCTGRVGYYDDGFYPAYYEDTDYHRRMTLAGVEAFRLPTDHAHEGWATIKREGHDGPTYRGQQKCLEYYVRKWGGAPGAERFERPFDGRGPALPAAIPRAGAWVDVHSGSTGRPAGSAARPTTRYDVINRVLEKIGSDRYLEIGVGSGETMRRVRASFKVGVDPSPHPDGTRATTESFALASDAFFARGDAVGRFGAAFVDGLHHADQVYRDIENACRVSDVVVVHNASPPTEAMQVVPYRGGNWTGDVWKAVARVRAEGQHAVRTIDADYGVAVVVPDRGEEVPELPREAWADLAAHRAELLGLVAPDAWEEWFDMANRRERLAARATQRKLGIEPGKICLCMIVKNESAVIERCLEAALPFIDCWAIADTGSTDDTPAKIERFFAARGVPGKIGRTTFKNFSQARNEALALARTVPGWHYALLIDADMILSGTLDRAALAAPAYLLVQRTSGLDYWNTRLVRRDVPAKYVGVTHEFLSVDSPANLASLAIDDRCDGGARADKSDRDIRLLSEDLAENPKNYRSMFYLAQTYREAGRFHEAIQWYRRHVELATWDEEIWEALYGIAQCYRGLGDEPQMTKACLEAYNARPGRGEPLKLLAQHLRERGQNESACLIAEAIPDSTADILFVERGVYAWGRDEELAIAGYYSKFPGRREAAGQACARLTTCADAGVREQARKNFVHYVKGAGELFGAEVRPIDWEPGDGYRPMNPSVCVGPGGRRLVLVRTVNYTVTQEGQYPTLDGSGIIRTRNHVLEMSDKWSPIKSTEIRNDPGLPARKLGFVEGYEDCRLWWGGDGYRASCTVRDAPDGDGRCELAVVTLDAAWSVTAVDEVRDYEHDRPQKNWMPIVGRPGQFVYLCDPTVVVERSQGATREVARSVPAARLADLRGGSQLVAHGGGWLAVTHEVAWCPHRVYLHRFVRFDADFRATAASDPFYFVAKGIEFCAGLARDGGKLVASFGVNDASAHLAFFDPAAVDRALRSW
jgi:tetratricopeptide (TPR) repeat protein